MTSGIDRTDGFRTSRFYDGAPSQEALKALNGKPVFVVTPHPAIQGGTIKPQAQAKALDAADRDIMGDAAIPCFTRVTGPNIHTIRYSVATTNGSAFTAGAMLSADAAIAHMKSGGFVFAEVGDTTPGKRGTIGFRPEGSSNGSCGVLGGNENALRSFLAENGFDPLR